MTDFLGESGSMNDLIKKSGKGEVVIIAHGYTSTGYGMREKIGERLERENPDKLFLYLNWEMDTGLTGSVKNIMEGLARGEINAEMRFSMSLAQTMSFYMNLLVVNNQDKSFHFITHSMGSHLIEKLDLQNNKNVKNILMLNPHSNQALFAPKAKYFEGSVANIETYNDKLDTVLHLSETFGIGENCLGNVLNESELDSRMTLNIPTLSERINIFDSNHNAFSHGSFRKDISRNLKF